MYIIPYTTTNNYIVAGTSSLQFLSIFTVVILIDNI